MTKFDFSLEAEVRVATSIELNTTLHFSLVLTALLLMLWSQGMHAQSNPDADYIRSSQPPLLSYQELVTLSENEKVDPALTTKLSTLLTTPFINNEAYFAGARPIHRDLHGRGPSVRLLQWNIERGGELDDIKLLFTDKQAFLAKVQAEAETNKELDRPKEKELSAEIDSLQSADIIVLNEADWGMKRSGYQAVVKELADALHMNWAYGVEFVEVDPKVLGLQSFANVENAEERQALEKLFNVDKNRVLGLHGTAILSHYPLRDVRLVPFKYQAYDWYNEEKKYGKVEEGKRKGASVLFGEEIVREVRRGGRTNLIATIDVPELPAKQVTLVATHLENRTTPKGRVKQAEELLEGVRAIRTPLVIAGDMNTTGTDGSVLSIKSAVLKKINNPSFWATQGLKYATGVGLLIDVTTFGFKTTKFQADPTSSGVPLLAPNPEEDFFDDLNKYRFDDGSRIDYRGDAELSLNHRDGTLGNSNERASKGFVTTFSLPRTLGPKGKFKLDWIFVKADLKDENDKTPASYQFAPSFASTMDKANEALDEPISDHAAISVDLPLTVPPQPPPK